ncbi:MAG: DinB family protein [Anaerolineales bacterium]|nr:DinB family protein [Anaerolineales bacterium]
MKPTKLSQAVQNYAEITHLLTDSELDSEWSWKDYNEGVRFAFFRIYEELRQLASRLGSSRSSSSQPLTTAQLTLAQYHAAYRDLQAVLIGVSDAESVRPPAENEWPVREALVHIISAERAFFAVNLDALERMRSEDGRPLEMSEEAWDVFWMGDTFKKLKEGAASSELLAYYDKLHWRILTELTGITEDELLTPVVFWESTPMSLEFRTHRFDAHLRQHTIQVEKTLEAINIPFTEAKRLLRLIYAALAEVETQTIGAWDFGAAEQGKVLGLINGYTDEINEILKG